MLERERNDGYRGEYLRVLKLSHGAVESRVVRRLTFTVRTQDQESGSRLVARRIRQQVQAGLIGPVQIIENEEQWLLGRDCSQD